MIINDWLHGPRKATKEEKKEIKKQEHLRKAECIKEFQAEADKIEAFLDAKKDELSKGERKVLKKQLKEKRGMLFELKHPVLNGTKNFLIGLYEIFEDIMDSSSEAYDNTYGGDGYTREDEIRVAIAMNEFGPVAAEHVRGEIEARIENERSSQPGNDD